MGTYRITTLLFKVAVVLAPVFGALGVDYVRPETFENWNAQGIIGICGVMVALVTAGRNLFNNWRKLTELPVAKCLIPLLLIPGLALGGVACITVRTIDETGAETTTTRLDVEVIVAITQLVMTNAPTAIQLAAQIQELFEQPPSASREERLAVLLEHARVLLETYYANQSPVPPTPPVNPGE